MEEGSLAAMLRDAFPYLDASEDAPSVNPTQIQTDQDTEARRYMTALGVSKVKVHVLIARFPLDVIQRQIAAWPKRDKSKFKSEPGAFVTSIE